MKEEVTSLKRLGSCAVSSAASTGYGLGSGTFAKPPSLGQNWKGNWMPRKIEAKALVKDRSMRKMADLLTDGAGEHPA